MRSRSAFTLIELLVVIAIVAVVLSLALPSLAGARASARKTQSASNLRQLGTVLTLYANDAKGSYPAVVEGRMYQIARDHWLAFPYWQVYETWIGIVYDYLPADENSRVYFSPGMVTAGIGMTSYMYSLSVVGSPRLWEPGAPGDRSLEVGQRVDQVSSPSGKALMWDVHLGWSRKPLVGIDTDIDEPTPVMMADVSVSPRIPAEAAAPVRNPIETASARDARLHNTPSGVLGRDF